MSSGVPFPGDHCSTFLRFTEEKVTLTGLGEEEETAEKEIEGLRLRKTRDTFNMNSCLS